MLRSDDRHAVSRYKGGYNGTVHYVLQLLAEINPMKVMLLAAGYGKRMGALTSELPKPLIEVAGRSLIERNIDALVAAGLRDFVVNLSYRGDQIREAVGNGAWPGVDIRFSQEPEPPLETGGGIVHALPLLGEGPFMLVNADVVADLDFDRLAAHRRTLVLVPNPPHHPGGDFGLAADGLILDGGDRLTFSGLSMLDTGMFAGLDPGPRSLKSVLDVEIAAGRLRGIVHDGLWLDVGSPERLAEAERQLGDAS